MTKIVRTPTRAAGGITAAEKTLLDEHAKLWIARALRTTTCDRVEVSVRIVLAHSETGHDHVMVLDKVAGEPAVEHFLTDNPLVSWIKVNRPTALEHPRPFDTHEPIMFGPGVYEVRRQREYTAEGFRRVED